jgi:hypothetical protein
VWNLPVLAGQARGQAARRWPLFQHLGPVIEGEHPLIEFSRSGTSLSRPSSAKGSRGKRFKTSRGDIPGPLRWAMP